MTAVRNSPGGITEEDLNAARIMIVDDEPINIVILERTLRGANYTQLFCLDDPREALDTYRRVRPDLVLLDLMMPHLDGFEVLEALRSEVAAGSFLPAIMLTADVSRETRRKALTLGARDFLTKPLDLDEVVLRIRNQLELWLLHRRLQLQNEELEAFTYTASHDLQAPLRRIGAYSHLISEQLGPDTDPEIHHYLERIRTSSQGLKDLVDGLLSLSGASRSAVQCKTIDLGKMSREILVDLVSESPERQLEVIIGGDLLVEADEHLLRTALENLLRNAWKFTRGRSTTRLEVNVLNMLQHEQGKVWFVRDNGVGFDSTNATKLFQPFHRLHSGSQFEGSGIGLATVRRIIERHGGRIWAESVAGEGSTFYFTLEQPQRAYHT